MLRRLRLRLIVLVEIPCIFLMYFWPKYAEFALTSVILCIKFNVFFYAVLNPPPMNKKIPKRKQTKLSGFISQMWWYSMLYNCTHFLVQSPKRIDITMRIITTKKQINKS